MISLSRELMMSEGLKLDCGTKALLPEKVLQFGEGNFLRGFVDWMFSKMNQTGLFNGSVVVVQPIREGLVHLLNEQDGLYTLILRGIQNGETVNQAEVITSIKRGINLYEDFHAFVEMAESSDLRVIVSNTTEAGICYNAEDKLSDTPPASFPGKLAVLLHKRFTKFEGDPSKGLIIMPCELIDRNGDILKNIILKLADEWQLGSAFIKWVNESNYFLNTLVDRIVTGYPRDEIKDMEARLGYSDKLVNTGEIFHLWVIEGDKKLSEELPFTQAGLNVVWTDDMTPYRSRKVRILNGAHTMTVLAAYLYGKDTVKECMDDDVISSYMKKGIFGEIIPTLDLPLYELEQFATDVLERFSNPFIKHYLLSISLNSVSKFKTRVLPSILEYHKRTGELPKVLCFSLASLFAFYRGSELREGALIGLRNGAEYRICDDMPILEYFNAIWYEFDGSIESIRAVVLKLLARTDWWGLDLTLLDGLSERVAQDLYSIVFNGMEQSIKELM